MATGCVIRDGLRDVAPVAPVEIAGTGKAQRNFLLGASSAVQEDPAIILMCHASEELRLVASKSAVVDHAAGRHFVRVHGYRPGLVRSWIT